jgi:hypothetical protein
VVIVGQQQSPARHRKPALAWTVLFRASEIAQTAFGVKPERSGELLLRCRRW